jgi:hypothetical protein
MATFVGGERLAQACMDIELVPISNSAPVCSAPLLALARLSLYLHQCLVFITSVSLKIPARALFDLPTTLHP